MINNIGGTEMLVLPDKESIKNPYKDERKYILQRSCWFEGVDAVYFAAKEIDIDKAVNDWRVKCFDTPGGERCPKFSEFLKQRAQ